MVKLNKHSEALSSASGLARPVALGDVVAALERQGAPPELVNAVTTALTPPPPELITLDQAAQRNNLSRYTVVTWLRRGHLREAGRQRGPARNGGKVLVDAADVARLVADPPRQGRPRKYAA